MRRIAAALPVVAQLAGGAAGAVGVYLLAGIGWALLALGLVLLAGGTLAEIGGRS